MIEEVYYMVLKKVKKLLDDPKVKKAIKEQVVPAIKKELRKRKSK